MLISKPARSAPSSSSTWTSWISKSSSPCGQSGISVVLGIFGKRHEQPAKSAVCVSVSVLSGGRGEGRMRWNKPRNPTSSELLLGRAFYSQKAGNPILAEQAATGRHDAWDAVFAVGQLRRYPDLRHRAQRQLLQAEWAEFGVKQRIWQQFERARLLPQKAAQNFRFRRTGKTQTCQLHLIWAASIS